LQQGLKIVANKPLNFTVAAGSDLDGGQGLMIRLMMDLEGAKAPPVTAKGRISMQWRCTRSVE